ncbi:MAG: trehalose-phosphatase [Nitriliruptoraceae bacterium]
MNPAPSDPRDIAAALNAAGALVLVIDFDGTLSTIVRRPEDASLVDCAANAIARVASEIPVAISSGRGLDDLMARVGSDLPVIFIGGHGSIVRQRDGAVTELVDTLPASEALDELALQLQRIVADRDGWQIERKPTSIAAHYRRADDSITAAVLPEVRATMRDHQARPPGFELLDGKSVVELRARAADKGRALSHLMRQFPGRIPVAIGDDVTDEDAFAAAVDLSGFGVIVGPATHPTHATWRLDNPAAVVTLLDALEAERATSSTRWDNAVGTQPVPPAPRGT